MRESSFGCGITAVGRWRHNRRLSGRISRKCLRLLVIPGGEANFIVILNNRGTKTAENVKVKVAFAGGLTPIAVKNREATISADGLVTFDTIPAIAVGVEERLLVQFAAAKEGDYQIQTDVVYNDVFHSVSKPETFTRDVPREPAIVPPQPKLEMEIVGPDELRGDESVTYTLVVRNVGNNTVENLRFELNQTGIQAATTTLEKPLLPGEKQEIAIAVQAGKDQEQIDITVTVTGIARDFMQKDVFQELRSEVKRSVKVVRGK